MEEVEEEEEVVSVAMAEVEEEEAPPEEEEIPAVEEVASVAFPQRLRFLGGEGKRGTVHIRAATPSCREHISNTHLGSMGWGGLKVETKCCYILFQLLDEEHYLFLMYVCSTVHVAQN